MTNYPTMTVTNTIASYGDRMSLTWGRYSSVILRCGLGLGFLSAVADRLGLWGTFGQPNVEWGNFSRFLEYTHTLNWYVPARMILPMGVIATGVETLFGLLLLLGWHTPAMEHLGAVISVVPADVSRPDDVDMVLAGIAAGGTSPLSGVVHAAGVDTTIPLSEMTATDIRASFSGKAVGAWLLHDKTRHLDLELFVCFSSVAAVLGSQGRAHYAAANAFLDELTLERRRLGLVATVINWGPWKGGGMATPDHLQQFDRIGNHGLEPGDALRALGSVVAAGDARAIVADIDWDTFRPIYERRRSRPILSELVVRDRARDNGSSPTVAPWIDHLQTVNSEERVSELAMLLRSEVADTMGFDDPASVPLDRNFYQIGVDSLMMAELVSRLKKQVGISCSALVFDHPNVQSLATRLLERLPLDRPAGSSPIDPPAVASTHMTGYEAGAEPDIFAFQARAWPHRSVDLIPTRWRWMFVDSARRLAVEPRAWLYRDRGRIVGHMGSIPVRMKIGNEERQTGWLVDTMVLEAYRDQAVGSRLMVDAHEDQPFSLSLGQTAQMREIQFHLGWKQVAPLQIAQLLVRPVNVLKGKLPAPAAWAADLSLRASSAMRNLLGQPVRLDVRPIVRFDEQHDKLWAIASKDLACAVVRDASYLNWKYVAQPGQRFVRLEMTDDQGIRGVVVWMFREPDTAYRYRRAFLVDLVASFSDASSLQEVIKVACAVAVGEGADALLCHHIDDRVTRALRSCGFHLRQPERFLLVDPGPLSGAALDRILSPESWFVTQGDSDIDRPW